MRQKWRRDMSLRRNRAEWAGRLLGQARPFGRASGPLMRSGRKQNAQQAGRSFLSPVREKPRARRPVDAEGKADRAAKHKAPVPAISFSRRSRALGSCYRCRLRQAKSRRRPKLNYAITNQSSDQIAHAVRKAKLLIQLDKRLPLGCREPNEHIAGKWFVGSLLGHWLQSLHLSLISRSSARIP